MNLRLALLMICLVSAGFCSAQTAPIFNVRNYGAAGDGTTLDSPAINAAIAAAAAAGGGMVTFPAGTYFCGSIHPTNNLTLCLSNGAVITASKTDIDPAETSAFAGYQDYGHSYFHDALIWGENLTNLTFAGPGEINGNGNLTTQTPAAGQGDKALCLVLCSHVVITNLTITRGGHFGILANGCSNLLVSGAQILESSSRDGFNLISSSDVIITNCTITGSDDAMVLKSDYALGLKINSQDIHIVNCQILSTENNALQFGSETVGDFRDVTWSNIGIGGAGKAGIGITSQDGSVIDGVTYDNITMTNCACPVLLKLDSRTTGSPNPSVGRIRNISLNNVTAYHSTLFGRTNTATIDGYNTVPIENITFNNVNLSTIGGNPATAVTNYPVQNGNWTPDSMGVRPSFGWYVRYAGNISFTNCQVHFDNNDDRPAVVTDTVTNILFSNFKADVGSNNTNYDLDFLNTSGYGAVNDVATAAAPSPGATLRVNAGNATPALIVSPPHFSPGDGTYSAAQSVAIASGTPGAAIRYTMDGTTPTPTNGTLYSAPVAISQETILLAVAYADGMTNSAVNTAIYNFPGTSLSLASPPVTQTNVTFAFEAENLPYTTNGAAAVLQNDANTSGGHWLALEAAGLGPSISYTVTNIPAGTYDIQMSWKGNTQRGIITFTLDGTVLGSDLDQYSATQVYPVTDYGIVTFTNNANRVIRLAVVAANNAATGYWISTDRFVFTQLQPGLPSSPRIGTVGLSGGNLQFSGTAGIPLASYYVLVATNLALPPAGWTVVATNAFDAGGNFNFTGVVNADAPKQFYRLECPLLELP
ncbi:MAG TPA: glycosyl hydrolase family 28 protein [Candidatus Acidoferrales bacterium]|jgi:polygalacturonase|nr:glycosyl hydrolase family 28 protein [Candidatus Acidoferrales bacterium]